MKKMDVEVQGKKIGIIGASYLQKPLVEKAKAMGVESHVFAWPKGNVVEDICDFYYPISITEKEEILAICRKNKIDGIISIASDLAMPTVNFVAEKMKLTGNSLRSTRFSTDKFEMRKKLKKAGLKTPNFEFFSDPIFSKSENLKFPIIVKPTDRSGSRGVTKVVETQHVNLAIQKALKESIKKCAIAEEFIEGKEYSVEFISFSGKHLPLAITEKVTTGPPYFIEVEHHQPAEINKKNEADIFSETIRALDALEIQNGVSHTELILDSRKNITIVEVAGRMGGDFIGSTLIELSSGIDLLKASIQVSLGRQPDLMPHREKHFAGIHFLTQNRPWVHKFINSQSSVIYKYEIFKENMTHLNSSEDRSGYVIYKADRKITYGQ
ncbi:ATP-grasp domain-containing protein [Christiangramia crocea]|uniref:ATP-grasp domain-containing protein n=1 Tax=Christiangramia crocea TaxID=2904124 RepID=A0A9X1UUT4_9FLAO|nr:ATP-grasp domain-containing protein [Gramella crocea]MCG9970435.1 ATP-grasp domain-containing protein [Gramella crocea]